MICRSMESGLPVESALCPAIEKEQSSQVCPSTKIDDSCNGPYTYQFKDWSSCQLQNNICLSFSVISFPKDVSVAV